MKKILKASIIMLLMIMCIRTYVYAVLSCSVNLKVNKTELIKNEEFVTDVVLSNVQSEKGIIALGATLEYDTNILEIVKMEGKNGWTTPSYNENNGKMITDRSGLTTDNEIMFQITFKIKDQSQKNATISLKDISVSNGDEETKVNNTSNTITIKSETSNSNTNTTNNTPDTTEKDDKITSNRVLPNTGGNNILFITLSIIFVLAAIFYIKIKLLNKEIEKQNDTRNMKNQNN